MRVSVSLALCFLATPIALVVLAWSAAGQTFPAPQKPLDLPKKAIDLYGDPLPSGALVRLGTVRFRRTSEHTLAGLAFLADNKTLLTAQGHDLQIWDSANGRLLRTLHSPVTIEGFAITADRKQIAVAGHPRAGANPGAGEIHVFDVASGKTLRVLTRNDFRGLYRAKLAFSPDNTLLFSVAGGGVLRVEELTSGQQVLQKQFPKDYVQGLMVSSDGRHVALASGPNSQKLYLWKWREEEPSLLLEMVRVEEIRFSPDGKLLAAISKLPDRLHVWHVADRKLAYQRTCPDKDGRFLGIEFTPDNRTLLVTTSKRSGSGQGQTWLFEPDTGQSKGVLPGSGFRLAVSTDSALLARPYGQGLRILDLVAGKELTDADEGHAWTPMGICFSPHGHAVTRSNDNTVRIWDAATGKHQRVHRFDGWVRDIALSPDGRLLVVSSFDDTVRVIAFDSGKEIYRLPGHGRAGGQRMLAFAPDGLSFLSWGDDFYLRRWDVRTGRALLEHAIRPSGVELPNPDNPNDFERREFLMGSMGSATVTPDGKTFLLECAGHCYSFDVATGLETKKFVRAGPSGGSMSISSNGKYLLTSQWASRKPGAEDTQVVIVRNIDSDTSIMLALPGRVAGPVAFSPDGRSFATSVDGTKEIRIFETASLKERYRVRDVPGRVRSLAFVPDGRRLASGLTDSTVLIWDLTAPFNE